MKKCGHDSHKNCAWDNASYHKDYPKEEQYRVCFYCKGLMNKGAYLGEQDSSDFNWNIHHLNHNRNDNRCENLIATHPECNVALD